MPKPHFAARPELSGLTPYNFGLTLDDVRTRSCGGPVAKLGSNENPYPMAEEVRAAIEATLDQTYLYPDPRARALSAALSKRTGLAPEALVFGDGSEDLLNILCRAVLRAGDDVITLYPSFPLHEDYARMMGAEVTRIALTADRRIDVAGLCEAMARPHRLTLLSNPSNPTGLWLDPRALAAVLDAQHPESVLCLDEAYAEYAVGTEYRSGLDLLESHRKPLLVLRTFSKAYGLAALRIGYGASNSCDLLAAMNLVRTPFNVNGVAQVAAEAALAHGDRMEAAVRASLNERARMKIALKEMGLQVLPSKGNFLFVDCGRNAMTVADRLLDRGVVVKPWKQPGFETFLRVSAGLPRETTQFLNALAHCLDR